jgi:hypothetical protein
VFKEVRKRTGLKKPKKERGLPQLLTKGDLEAFFEAIDNVEHEVMMRCNRRSGKDGRLITLAATKPIRLVNSYEASKSRIGRGDLDWACAAVWF